MQSQPFSPFAWVAIASTSPRAYDVFVLLRFYVAGLFAFLFLRRFVRFRPALLGGASFMYAGYFWLYVTIPEMSAEVALPAIFYGTELLLRRQTSLRFGLLALALSLGVVGGMPESLLLECTLAFAVFASRPLLVLPGITGANSLTFIACSRTRRCCASGRYRVELCGRRPSSNGRRGSSLTT